VAERECGCRSPPGGGRGGEGTDHAPLIRAGGIITGTCRYHPAENTEHFSAIGDDQLSVNSMEIQVIGVQGLPLIRKGDDLPALICDRVTFEDGDILTIASSVYSKAKGFHPRPCHYHPERRRRADCRKDKGGPRFVQAVLDSSSDILLEHPFILSEVPSGHIGVRAGRRPQQHRRRPDHHPPPPRPHGGRRRDPGRNPAHHKKRMSGLSSTDTCGRSV